MRLPLKHLVLVVLVAVAVFIGGVLYPMWRQAVDQNRDARADPHHIAGNLYFVGAPDLTSFLLVGSQGHALIGSGSEETAHKIVDNVEQLGFDPKEVRILLATDPHPDEAGGLATLQQVTGAELWASDANAEAIAAGGRNDPSVVYPPYRLMASAGVTDYPAPRVDHRFQDGETIRLGSLAVTPRLTPGHAPGCTTWTFTVRERDRDLHVVHRCGLEPPYGASLVDPERPAGVRADLERSLRLLRELPVDIWLTSHGVEYGRFRKYQESLKSGDPVAPFVDRKGYFDSIDKADAAFRKQLAGQQPAR